MIVGMVLEGINLILTWIILKKKKKKKDYYTYIV